MKYVIFILTGMILASCSTTSNEDINPEFEVAIPEVIPEEEVIEENVPKPGIYKEFHEDGSLKIEGNLNENGERTGLWVSYYPDSSKWSESYYVKGKRDGHSITFYENGGIRYVGEYREDKQFGEWTFYTEEGEVSEVKQY